MFYPTTKAVWLIELKTNVSPNTQSTLTSKARMNLGNLALFNYGFCAYLKLKPLCVPLFVLATN